ncbi:MAG TPA: DUF4115 domain-containing protein [Firmicutes bacterium]|nr:DUF4115 domain-containing protein [Bacillota bacterium]
MTDAGRMLEEARLSKGITLDKVEADLKIRKAYILAMESGRWEELPGYAYAIGFLRTYAEYLGLSGDEIVQEYKTWRELQGNEILAEEPPVGVFHRAKELQTDSGIFQLSAKDKSRGRRRKGGRGLALILIILVALIAYLLLNWYQSFFGTGGGEVPGREVGDLFSQEELQVEPLPEVGISIGETEAHAPSPPGEDEPLAPVEVASGDRSDEKAEGEEPLDDTVPPPGAADAGLEQLSETAAGADEPEEVHVTLPDDEVHRLPMVTVEEDIWPITLEAVAEGRCWVEVRCDGEVKLSRTIEAGESFRWQAAEEIRIRFGRADVVRLKLNGQDIGPAGKGVVTRVFTAE